MCDKTKLEAEIAELKRELDRFSQPIIIATHSDLLRHHPWSCAPE